MLKSISISKAFQLILILTIISLATIFIVNLQSISETNNVMEDYTQTTKNSPKYIVKTARAAIETLENMENDKLLTRPEAQAIAHKMLKKMMFDTSTYVYIMDDEGHMLSHPTITNSSESQTESGEPHALALKKLLDAGKNSSTGVVVDYMWDNASKTGYVYRSKLWHWSIMSAILTQHIIDAHATLSTESYTIIGAIVISALILLIFIIAMTVDITMQIKKITAHVARMAAGDLTEEVHLTDYNPSIGGIGSQIEIFRDQLKLAKEAELQQEENLKRMEEDSKRDLLARIGEFEKEISHAIELFANSSHDMKQTAVDMSGLASSSEERAVAITKAANSSSENIDRVAASAEEMHSSIQEVSHNISEGAMIAQKGTNEGQQTVSKIETLVQSVGKISEVVSLITDIADQTNLLALNATIEAARAGDAGKGFAVVASEVKNLASQTAKATEDIRSQIETVQGETSEASIAVNSIVTVIEETSERYSAISSAIEEQTATMGEINRNMDTIRLGAQEISSGIAEVKAGSTQVNTSSSNVLKSSDELKNETDILQSTISTFLSSMK